MTTRPTQTQLAVRNSVGTPLGQLSHGAIIRDSPGFPNGPMRVYGLYALVYLLGGGGTYQGADGGRQPVRPGDLIVVFPDIAHTYGPGVGQHWDELHVVFAGPVFDLWRQSGLLESARPLYHLEPIDHWLNRLRAFIDGPLPTTSVGKTQELCRFLSLLTDITAPAALAAPARPLWLSEALGLLEADLREAMPLDTVAQAIGMPYETFRKRFAQQMGLSPARYRARSRVSVAKDLLVHTRMSSRQVAESLGFADEFHFSKRFKQIVGETPRRFRQGLHGGTIP